MKRIVLIVLSMLLLLTCLVSCAGVDSEIARAEAAVAAFEKSTDMRLDKFEADDEDTKEMAEWLTEGFGIEVEFAVMYTLGMDDLFVLVCIEEQMAEDVVNKAKKHGSDDWESDGHILVYGDADDVIDFMEILSEQ